MTEVTVTRPDDADDNKPFNLPAGAQIHHHNGTKPPEDWTWLCGRKEAPECRNQNSASETA